MVPGAAVGADPSPFGVLTPEFPVIVAGAVPADVVVVVSLVCPLEPVPSSTTTGVPTITVAVEAETLALALQLRVGVPDIPVVNISKSSTEVTDEPPPNNPPMSDEPLLNGIGPSSQPPP